MISNRILAQFSKTIDGDFYYDSLMRSMYATDASLYRELPLAVCYPKHDGDLKKLIHFCNSYETSLIPRTAGTSLAGQCVGKGIVVDVSKYFTQILEVNTEENWVRVQPGVVRDHLNHFLKPHGLFFGPNTSTANRAMIGGMVGNNSCGSYSIVYGTTRDHVLEIKAILSDGSETVFGNLSKAAFKQKALGNTLESSIYRQIAFELNHPLVQREIEKEFPKPSVTRRNTGYAVDEILKSNAFKTDGDDFNFCKLLAGSEGSLCFFTEIKLHLNPLPPSNSKLVCAHFNSVDESLRATVIAMKHKPRQCELMDKIILDCTKENIVQAQNRFFIEKDPEAILMIEFGEEDITQIDSKIIALISDFNTANVGYAFPILEGQNIQKALQLRAAGLGVLSNVKGTKKPQEFVEDTAVDVEDLPAYIREYKAMLDKYNTSSVYYAHAGAGELHLRPILDLKTTEGLEHFRKIGEETAHLVKKYKGSLSGEHGDGIVRAEFIPIVLGEKNYQLFQRIKQTWDPKNIFNPGKIVNAPKMDEGLRYSVNQSEKPIETIFDFSHVDGVLHAAEKCSGSGDCRKTPISGGTMCPSYMATKNEKDTTRARANILREFLTHSPKKNKFNHEEIKQVMDLCLSCKGCASECPSNVDMATLKAEFSYQYYKTNPASKRTLFFADFTKWAKRASTFPRISNFFSRNNTLSKIPKKLLGIATERSLPAFSTTTFHSWYKKNKSKYTVQNSIKKVYLFVDEFTNYNEAQIGIKAFQLLYKLGYAVEIPNITDSGRSYISKGILDEAKKLAILNIQNTKNNISENTPLIGIEPSAILSFRDEYPKLVSDELKQDAKKISTNTFLIDEFLAQEIKKGNITSEVFTTEQKEIVLHGHCHQKTLSSTSFTKEILSLPLNYNVSEIPSGCCGMAGSFGYEKEHYTVSMQVGELVLFPSIRNTKANTLIAANGTSCRHQIHDGAQRIAFHPIEIIFDALKK